jgi:hypothetical protein
MKREDKIAAIGQALLHHNYNLVIFDETDYEIRDINTGEVCWDFDNSEVPLEEFDVNDFLGICGWIEN